jgi:ribosomal-protein-alanine N-acetyltransferase
VNCVTRADNNFTQNVHRAEIGYHLIPQYWDKGYMTEALRSVIPHIFTNTGVDRLEAFIRPENTRSHKVVSRVGFQKEGVLRNYVLWEGERWDFVLYSLLKHEWGTTV